MVFCFRFLADGFRRGLVRRKMEVRRQFSGCIIQAQAKKIGSQVDDVPVRSAGKTVVVVVCYQQAGVVVVDEGAERHSTAVDRATPYSCAASLALTAVFTVSNRFIQFPPFLDAWGKFLTPLYQLWGKSKKTG